MIQKYATFIIFIILVALWGALFAGIKFFIWGELGSTLAPDLQQIAGYLSLGGIFAYLIGGAFAVTFLKKYFMFVVSLISILFVCFAYFIGLESNLSFAVVVSMLGFLYGLWNVLKNVILAIEIKKTGLPETVVNAIAGIVFVIFIIVGSLVGSLLFESIGKQGYLVIIGILFLTAGLGFSLDYDKVTFKSLLKNGWKTYFQKRKKGLERALALYIPDLKYIVANYTGIILGSAFLWTISTVVSQASVEYSVDKFQIEASSATYLLLYSALGAIIGNIISMKMNTSRWKFFIIFNTLFGMLIILFPFLAQSFSILSILAIFLGLLFGVSSNLVDSYLLKLIGEEDKKEYGASTHGLILSITIVVMMFLSSTISENFGYMTLMISLGLIMIIVGGCLYARQIKVGK